MTRAMPDTKTLRKNPSAADKGIQDGRAVHPTCVMRNEYRLIRLFSSIKQDNLLRARVNLTQSPGRLKHTNERLECKHKARVPQDRPGGTGDGPLAMVLEAGMDLGRLFAAPVPGGLAGVAEGGVAEVAVGSVAVAAEGVLAGLPFPTPLTPPRAAAAPPGPLLVFFFVVSTTAFFGAVAAPHARPATPLLLLSSWPEGILPRECVVLARSPATPSEGASGFLAGGVTLALLGEGVTEVLLAGGGRALPCGVGRGGGVEDDFFLSRSGRFLLVLLAAALSVTPGDTLVLVPDEGKERDGAAAAEGATGPTFFLLEEVAHAPPLPWILFFPFSPSSLP